MSEVDQPNENDIREIKDETLHNWEQMIREGGKLSETKVNIVNMGYEIDNNNLVGVLEPIYKKMAMEKEKLT